MVEVYSNIGRLNHVAIAVPDIKLASEMWQKALGANVSKPKTLTEHGVKIVLLNHQTQKLNSLNH